MAIFIVENSGKVGYGIKRYICKTMEDIPVEVNGEEIAPGSRIYVTDEKKTYMLNTVGQWVEITEGGGGGASSIDQLSDVTITSPQDGQVLVYDETSGKWENINFIDDSHVKQNATWSSYKTNQLVIELGSSLSNRLPQRLHGILRAGQDKMGIVDTDFFEDNKAYWVSTNKFGVMPTDVRVSVSGQQIYMEFEPQDTDTEVEVIKI